MGNTAIKLHQEPHLKHWTDLWFAPDKKAGYVALANENYHNQRFFGQNDYKMMIQMSKGKKDKFLSLNAFEVADFGNIKHTRSAANLKQIRTIAIDIDQYNLSLTPLDVLDELDKLIKNGVIPKPNLITISRGVQIFYSIKGGLSPYRSSLSSYITAEFIQKLKHVGADGNAKDTARLMRVPGSINSRNNASVHWEIWEHESYDIWELRKYVQDYKPEKKQIKKRSNILSINLESQLMHRTNLARLSDFKTLIYLRKGDFTNKRNILLYNYAFHLALVEADFSNVLNEINEVFSKVSSKDKSGKTFDETEIILTTESAFEDAKTFIDYYQENNYEIIYNLNDGIIKPKKTETLLLELNITESEQKYMKTLANPYIHADNKRQRDKENIKKKRREKGIKSMSEYNNERKTKKRQNIETLKELMLKYPNYSQKQYAKIMKVSRETISRWKKLIT